MLKETLDFYLLTKIEDELVDIQNPPDSHVEIFKKSYPRLERFPIEELKTSDLEKLLESRQSTRRFSETPITLRDLSTLLSAYRVIDANRVPERRTYPSGGARYPIELYVVNFSITGIPKGIFHVNIEDRHLSLLIKHDYTPERRLFCSEFTENASASLVFTSVMARSEVKYNHMAYPASLIEIGHIAQNIVLAASELGIGACPIIGQVNEFVADELDLTHSELPLYAISLGSST